jgi:hypothetical protein
MHARDQPGSRGRSALEHDNLIILDEISTHCAGEQTQPEMEPEQAGSAVPAPTMLESQSLPGGTNVASFE